MTARRPRASRDAQPPRGPAARPPAARPDLVAAHAGTQPGPAGGLRHGDRDCDHGHDHGPLLDGAQRNGTRTGGARPAGKRNDAARLDHAARLDEAAGRIVRPYAVSNGRTRPATAVGPLVSLAATGGAPPVRFGPEHRQMIDLCAVPRPVAEVVARLCLPVAVTKVLIGDLLDCGALAALAPARRDDTEVALLEAVLAGLRRSL